MPIMPKDHQGATTTRSWQDFGLPSGINGRDVIAATASRNGSRTATAVPSRPWWHWQAERPWPPRERDRAGTWLRVAMVALGLLAAAAAAVSYQAQYVLVQDVKTTAAQVIAAIQAGIPDAGALVFAALGIALALHGKRAFRARALNLLCVAISLTMNAISAAPGWRALAVWVMPAALYALASDTLIMVIRADAIARARVARGDLADDEVTPLAVLGGLALWVLRLALAPVSTLAGFRRWVVQTCPVAPGTVAELPQPEPPRAITVRGGEGRSRRRRAGRKHRGGRGRARRPWAELSEAYRARLQAAGIGQGEYEADADISAARGHAGGAR